MKRIYLIDNIRSIAFILMIIQHIFYFYDVNNAFLTNISSNPLIELSGTVSRTLFIFLTGFSLASSYSKEKYKNTKTFLYQKLKRSLLILIHAFIITFVSYIFYPKYYVRFGVLHFIGLSTLLLSIITPYKTLYPIILLLSLYIKLNINKIPHINTIIDTIFGTNIYFNMMDYFPLIKNIPLLLLGMTASTIFDNDLLSKINILNTQNVLTTIGTNTLNLYTLHFIGLILFYVNFFTKKL